MRSSDQAARQSRVSGWGYLPLGLTLLVVVAILGVIGVKLATDSGWFRAQVGAISGGAPGIFSNGQLVKAPFRQAPDFTVQLYSGEQLRLADLRGRPVVVNFWASWCPPCRTEAPVLERVWREYKDKGVVFIGIGVWDSEQDARAFLDEFGITYPNGPDLRGEVAIEYGLAGIPETFFIDRQGQITRKWIGPFNETALRTFLDEIVASEG